MNEPRTALTAIKHLSRALRLRCPACGTKPLFVPWQRVRTIREWFTPLDGCPRCGYAYEREAGYFLMSIWAISYGAASVVGVTLYVVFEVFFHLTIGQLLAAVVIPTAFFAVLFARHAKALFLACDLFFDPHEREGGDDSGNKPLSPPPNGPSSPSEKPVQPCEPADVLR